MSNLAPLSPNIVIHMINTAIPITLFCIQMPFSLYLVSNTLCWVAVPLPPSVNALFTPNLPNTLPGLPLCLGSDSPCQGVLPSSVLKAISMHGRPHLSGSDTSHLATFLHRCSPRPVQVLTSCSGSPRETPSSCEQLPRSTPLNGLRSELFRKGREGKKETFFNF